MHREEEGPECPKCGAEMEHKTNRRGREWYECPECGEAKEIKEGW